MDATFVPWMRWLPRRNQSWTLSHHLFGIRSLPWSFLFNCQTNSSALWAPSASKRRGTARSGFRAIANLSTHVLPMRRSESSLMLPACTFRQSEWTSSVRPITRFGALSTFGVLKLTDNFLNIFDCAAILNPRSQGPAAQAISSAMSISYEKINVRYLYRPCAHLSRQNSDIRFLYDSL